MKLWWIRNHKFWSKALKDDFPLYVITASNNPHSEYRRLCKMLELDRPPPFGHLSNFPEKLIVNCLKHISPSISNQFGCDFFNKEETDSLQRLKFMTLLVLSNKYYMMIEAFNLVYGGHTPIMMEEIMSDINIIESAFTQFKNRASCKFDDDYIFFFNNERTMPPNSIPEDHYRRLSQNRYGDPTLFFFTIEKHKIFSPCTSNHVLCAGRNEEDEERYTSHVPYELHCTYSSYKFREMFGPAHFLNCSITASYDDKLNRLTTYKNDLWWSAALQNDFPFYKSKMRNVKQKCRRHYALVACNMFRIRENYSAIVNIIHNFTDLGIEIKNEACVAISDILVELLIRSPYLLEAETRGKNWIVPTEVKKEIDLSKIPTPHEFFKKKAVIPYTRQQAKLKSLYHNIKSRYKLPDFPVDQVSFNYLFIFKMMMLQIDERVFFGFIINNMCLLMIIIATNWNSFTVLIHFFCLLNFITFFLLVMIIFYFSYGGTK